MAGLGGDVQRGGAVLKGREASGQSVYHACTGSTLSPGPATFFQVRRHELRCRECPVSVHIMIALCDAFTEGNNDLEGPRWVARTSNGLIPWCP